MPNRKDQKLKQLKRERERRQERLGQLAGGARVALQLRQIERLIEDGDLSQAHADLARLHREFPDSQQILETWCDVCYDLEDTESHATVCEKLYKLRPGNADLALMLAGLYLKNDRPALASTQFARFVDKFPSDPRSDGVRETLDKLNGFVEERVVLLGLDNDSARQVLELHERSLSAISQGDPEQACSWIEPLLAIKPDFAPALNNLAEAQVQLGRVDAAVETLRRGLQLNPTNAYCQGSLVRALVLSGQVEEARCLAAGFRLTSEDSTDAFVRQAEALLLLDQNEAVLELPKLRAGQPAESRGEYHLLHLAAVAALRMERPSEAERLWKQIVAFDPEFSLARENLADLRLPIGKRHGPWLCPLAQWVSRRVLTETLEESKSETANAKEGSNFKPFDHLLGRFPHLPRLIPILLEHGDEPSRKFAIDMAKGLDTPELREALLSFALGKRGPDDLRFKVVTFLRERDALPSRVIKMWRDGEQRETLLHAFEVHYEPQRLENKVAQELHDKAYICLKDQDGFEAERLLREALSLEESPSILFNLAAAIDLQGRTEEAQAIFEDVHARFPDYFHGIVWRARQLTDERDFARASELLDQIRDRKRLHVTQFTSLCDAQMELLLAQGNKPGAQSWLEFLERLEPDHPVAKHWRQRLAEKKLFGRFGELLPSFARS